MIILHLYFIDLHKRVMSSQETVGYFFCLEDRALLCRKCDVAIHTVNSYVSAHRRFLLTGVKVGLEATEPVASSSGKTLFWEKGSETRSQPIPKRQTPTPPVGESKASTVHVGSGVQDFAPVKMSFTGGSTAGSIPQWHIDEYIGLTDFNENYEYMGNGSSKVCSYFSTNQCQLYRMYTNLDAFNLV